MGVVGPILSGGGSLVFLQGSGITWVSHFAAFCFPTTIIVFLCFGPFRPSESPWPSGPLASLGPSGPSRPLSYCFGQNEMLSGVIPSTYGIVFFPFHFYSVFLRSSSSFFFFFSFQYCEAHVEQLEEPSVLLFDGTRFGSSHQPMAK